MTSLKNKDFLKLLDFTPEEISYLRRRAIAMGQTNSEGARHALSFYGDVKRTGLLNETMLALRTEGLVNHG